MTGTRRTITVGAPLFLLITLAACGGGSTPATSASIGPVTVGEIDPLSGPLAGIGKDLLQGQESAVSDINANGGILGTKISQYSVDDAGDSVDAVPAMRQLLTHSPSFIVGPSSPTFLAVQPLVDQAKIVDFGNLPSAQFDTLSDKWVFRTLASDTVQGAAMAYYAIKQGWTHCSLLFENTADSQAVVAPIVNTYTKHGGVIDDNEQLVPGAASYRTELEKAFAAHPQCVFVQTDPTTTGTVWSDARELGLLNVPFVGTDVYDDPNVAKAAGLADFSRLATAIVGSTPTGTGWDHFVSVYQSLYGSTPNNYAAVNYDAVIVGALAIDAAKSNDPNVFVNDITSVSSSQGTKCYTYKDCSALLKAGKQISFQGASGPMDFDAHHSRYTGFDIVKSDASGNNFNTVFTVTGDQLRAFI
jgi:neutral amino acid transport system substrate-binding protein